MWYVVVGAGGWHVGPESRLFRTRDQSRAGLWPGRCQALAQFGCSPRPLRLPIEVLGVPWGFRTGAGRGGCSPSCSARLVGTGRGSPIARRASPTGHRSAFAGQKSTLTLPIVYPAQHDIFAMRKPELLGKSTSHRLWHPGSGTSWRLGDGRMPMFLSWAMQPPVERFSGALIRIVPHPLA